jgi:hypothetical protein
MTDEDIKMLADNANTNEKEEMVKAAKNEIFFYAGGSARWMFSFLLDELRLAIDLHFRRIVNKMAVFNGIVGDGSVVAVNHILGSNGFFVSEYVARIALLKAGEEVVHCAYNLGIGLKNPTITGWIVELDFIRQIQVSQGSMLHVKATDNSIANFPMAACNSDVNFPVDTCVKCDTDSYEDIEKKLMPLIQGNKNLKNFWKLPAKWNQGGYDLVWLQVVDDEKVDEVELIDKHTEEKIGKNTEENREENTEENRDKKLRVLNFIQVTNAETHSLKLKFFKD